MARFYDLLEKGETDIRFGRYYERYVSVTFKNPPSQTTLRHHVISCLGRDVPTGKKLEL